MVLDIDEIKQLILADTPTYIKLAREKQKQLDVHVNGVGVDKYLNKIEGFENEEQHILRTKHTISNKYLIANLLRPIDKIFSSKGGSKTYNIDGEKTLKDFTNKISNFRYGMPLRKWIQELQANKFYSDPSGVVLLELKDGVVVPTFKSIHSIKNYKTEGREVDYIIFEPYKKIVNNKESEEQYFRVIDDNFDYLFSKNKEVVTLVEEETYKNPWGRPPVIVNSNIVSSSLDHAESPIHEIVDLADKYLKTNSIKTIFEFLHGFPLFWMYYQKCKTCNGTGVLSNNRKCPTCKGSGAVLKRDVSDALILAEPKDKDSPIIAPNVGGYITPPLEIPKEQRDELNWLWRAMMFTIWGTSHENTDTAKVTATAATLNIQPQNDRLIRFTEAFEDLETKITNLMGELYYGKNYKGAYILYGRRYIIEPPDQLLKKYNESRINKAPIAALDLMLKEYYESEFSNDPSMMAVMIKLTNIEPYIHNTIEEIRGYASAKSIARKVWFGEWKKTASDEYLLTAPTEKLLQDLDNFIDKNQDQEKQDIQDIQ